MNKIIWMVQEEDSGYYYRVRVEGTRLIMEKLSTNKLQRKWEIWNNFEVLRSKFCDMERDILIVGIE